MGRNSPPCPVSPSAPPSPPLPPLPHPSRPPQCDCRLPFHPPPLSTMAAPAPGVVGPCVPPSSTPRNPNIRLHWRLEGIPRRVRPKWAQKRGCKGHTHQNQVGNWLGLTGSTSPTNLLLHSHRGSGSPHHLQGGEHLQNEQTRASRAQRQRRVGGSHPSEWRFGGFRQSAKRVLVWQARPTRPLDCGPPSHLRFYCLFVGPLTLPTPGRPLAPPAARAGRPRLVWPKIRVLLVKTSLAMCGFASWFALGGELSPPVWSTTCVGPPCLLPGALSCRLEVQAGPGRAV